MWIEEPFGHAVVDGHWDNDRLRAVAAEFPDPADTRWVTYAGELERGKRAGGEAMWGPTIAAFIDQLRSHETCQWLERLSGIANLTPDTLGGGMHLTTEGGRLGMHADFNRHPDLPHLVRRLNVLVFANPEWDHAWGGTLYLGEQREIAVEPTWNRTVVFATSARSYHGHPDPIVGEHQRRSIAVYYYAPDQGEEINTTTVWAA